MGGMRKNKWMVRMSIEENKNKRKLISRTQTENFLRLRYGKMWHLNEDYPYSYKRHGENLARFGVLGSTHRNQIESKAA